MNRNNQITISDIAEKAGTSKMTVSRVLNNHPYVNSKTRQKITDLMKHLKYHPNPTAVNLSKMSPQTIALIIQHEHLFTTYYFSEVLQGVEKCADDHSFNLIIFNYSTRQELEIDRITSWYYGKFIKGFLVLAPPQGSELVKRFKAEKIPFVVIGAHAGFNKVDFIDVENLNGAFHATEYLINLGHKNIGFIAGPADRGDARERELGYRKALSKYKLKFDPENIVCGYFSEDRGYQAMMQLLSREPRVTAVFAANDLMAKGALSAIRDSKLEVPRDISIIGFDDINVASQLYPPLSTVKQPMFRLGEEAARFLIETDEKQKSKLTRVLPTELIIRESCAHLWHF